MLLTRVWLAELVRHGIIGIVLRHDTWLVR
jgi:hypothetical protein